MDILIIYAHPETEGFNSLVLKKTREFLNSKNKDHEVWDLYKMGYDPVLKKEELYTAGNTHISEENSGFQKKIKQASKIIFIYPVWWGGMPAILKGFVDRVFVPGFAFKYKKDKLITSIPEKCLTDKRVVCLVTSGAPRFLYDLSLHPMKIINKFFIFGFFGAGTKTFQIYGAGKLNDKKKKEIDKNIKKGLKWLLK